MFGWIRLHLTFYDVAERSRALDSSSGVASMWVRIPAWPVSAFVSLSKTLNRNCFVLRVRHKAGGPVCCVMHVKEKGLAQVFLDLRLEHPGGWICACYKSYHYHCHPSLTAAKVHFTTVSRIYTCVFRLDNCVFHF